MKQVVLITGVGGPAGRSALKYFKDRGCFVVGTDVREVEQSPDVFHKVPLALDASYPSAILELVEKERPALFVPTVTEELVIASRMAGQVRSMGSEVFTSEVRASEVALDKLLTVRFFEGTPVAVPMTCEAATDAEEVVERLGVPLIVKPLVSRGGRGVKLLAGADEVRAEAREGVVFQEFIPGTEFDGNLFVKPDGRLDAVVVLEKTLLKEGLVGNAAGVERVENPEVADLCASVAERLHLLGPLDMDVRLRKDGTPVLLEINSRLGGNVLSAPEVLDAMYNCWKKGSKD